MKTLSDGEKLKAFRKYKELSQSELAQKVDKKTAAISKYESGETEIPLSVIRLLNSRLNMSFEWFFKPNYKGGMEAVVEKRDLVKDIGAILADYKLLEGVVEKQNLKISRLEATVKVILSKIEA